MELLGGQTFGLGIHSPGLVSAANPGGGGRAVRNGAARHSGAGGDEIHPRLEAVMNAARFHGMELDPRDFPRIHGEQMPSAAALSAWLQNAGMWARAVRLRWRQLMRLQDAGPVVLLFNDGGACIFAIPGEETIFECFRLVVFIHVSSRETSHAYTVRQRTWLRERKLSLQSAQRYLVSRWRG